MQSKNRLKSERPRADRDFYETPYDLCVSSLDRLFTDENMGGYIGMLDPGCGNGVWGKALHQLVAPTFHHVDGIDIYEYEKPQEYRYWVLGDYHKNNLSGCKYDLVAGNPPYNLAEEFVRTSFDVLLPDGRIFFLLRLAFLESKKRYFGLFEDYQPKRVYVLSRRPSFFSTNGRRTVDSLSYAMFLWQKGWSGKTELDWLYWDYST